jgi:hypothetical protein
MQTARALGARIAIATLGLGAATTASADGGADTDKTLIAAIGKACHGDANGVGRISASDLRKALSSAYPIVWDWTKDKSPSTGSILASIERAGRDHDIPDDDVNHTSFDRLGRYAIGWTTPGDAAALTLVQVLRANGSPARPEDLDGMLKTIFAGQDSDNFIFECKASSVPNDDAPLNKPDAHVLKAPPVKLVIARSDDQLGKTASDKKAGEFGLIDDRVKKSTSYATTIAAGLSIPILRPTQRDVVKPVQLVEANLTPFISYDRQGAKDATDASYVNNLSFGIATSGYLRISPDHGTPNSTYYSLSAKYETDDHFHSSAWFVQALIQPQIPIPLNTAPRYVATGAGVDVGLVWTVAGAADHSSVTDPWKKQALLKTKHFDRLGTESMAALLLRSSDIDEEWSARLEFDHSDRWRLSDEGGTAHLLGTKLTFAPTSSYSFSLGYQQGHELDSLASVKQWKMTIDLKK